MSEQRSQFKQEFLGTHVNYTNSDFEFDEVKQEYLNPYINHCYKLFLAHREDQCAIGSPQVEEEYFYVSFNESVVQELERINNSIDNFISKMQEVCRAFGAKGFYPNHTYRNGFQFESFMFQTPPDKSLWMSMNGGYLPSVPSLTKSLRILLNSKFKPVVYDNLITGLKLKVTQIKEIRLGEGCVILCLKKPIINYDVLVPTTREYYEYISEIEN